MDGLHGLRPALVGIIYALVVRLFSGVQLMVLGTFGEYLGRIYGEVKRRPLPIDTGAEEH